MVECRPVPLYGNWTSGFALDVHTISSVHRGVNESGYGIFDTTRSPLGQLLYQLKYEGNRLAALQIGRTAAGFLHRCPWRFDILVPVPPSAVRQSQPVALIADAIGRAMQLPVVECVRRSRSTPELKNIYDSKQRTDLQRDLYEVERDQAYGKTILLFDDLYRSGLTMNAVATLLLGAGGAARVYVLAITKTRSHR